MSKALIIFDSVYGNTAKIAQVIAGEAAESYEAELETVEQSDSLSLQDVGLLVVGSPTQGGRPTQSIQNFLDQLPDNILKGVSVVAFDTRFSPGGHGFGVRLLMKTFGFAAPRIAKGLQDKGGELATEPEGFIVEDVKGGLKSGELERAALWTRRLVHNLSIVERHSPLSNRSRQGSHLIMN